MVAERAGVAFAPLDARRGERRGEWGERRRLELQWREFRFCVICGGCASATVGLPSLAFPPSPGRAARDRGGAGAGGRGEGDREVGGTASEAPHAGEEARNGDAIAKHLYVKMHFDVI